jgi:hypothetical protein
MLKAIIISGSLSLLLVFIGIIGFAWLYDEPANVEKIQWKGSSMILDRGVGYHSGSQLIVTGAGEERKIRIISKQISFNAEDMPFLVWNFSKLSPREDVWVAWITKQNPRHLNVMAAVLPWDSTAVYRMKGNPEWKGEIVALGFGFEGQMYDSVTLDSVEARPYSIGTMLESIWDEWTAFEGWTRHSINYMKGGYDGDVLIRPSVVVAMLTCIAFFLYLVYSAVKRAPLDKRVFISHVVIGWITLDVMWQINLFRQHHHSFNQYYGKTLHEKLNNSQDAIIYDLATKVKAYIPNKLVQIVLIGDVDSKHNAYMLPRLQYHLLPYNVILITRIYDLYKIAKPGKYLMILNHYKGYKKVKIDEINLRIDVSDLESYNITKVFKSRAGSLYKIDSLIK